MRYGRQVVVAPDGDMVTATESIFNNFATVKKTTICTETVRVDSHKEILAEWLALLDRYKAGEIDLPGLQVLRDKNSGQLRIEKSWTVI